MEEVHKISRETICKILVEDSIKRKICSRFVMHCLSDEQQALTLQACREFIQSVDDEHSLLDSMVSGGKTMHIEYGSQTKRQSTECCSPSSPRHYKFSNIKSGGGYFLYTSTVGESFTKNLFHLGRC
jgi:hypothetical protein